MEIPLPNEEEIKYFQNTMDYLESLRYWELCMMLQDDYNVAQFIAECIWAGQVLGFSYRITALRIFADLTIGLQEASQRTVKH